MFFAAPHDLGCDDCPTNLLLVHHDPGVAAALLALVALSYAVLFVIVLVRLALRWRRTPPLERIQLTPVYACGLLAFLLVTVAQAGAGQRRAVGRVHRHRRAAVRVPRPACCAATSRGSTPSCAPGWRSSAPRARASSTASDTERRRLERNLHDGAQSRFVGLALLLGHARRRVDADPTDPEIADLLAQATAELQAGLAELRELARGIHPPLLTDQGLEPALHALAARAPVPVTLAADVGERLPAPVEIAAYFVVAEALANVGKYAQACEATIAVRRVNGLVTVEVADDGVGGADAGRGTGLRGLTDRVAVLDGTLAVDSPRGGGTRLHVEIPCGRGA